MKFKRQTFLLAIGLLLSQLVQAGYAIEGSCEEFMLLVQEDGTTVNTTTPLRVLRQNAPVYSQPHGGHEIAR